jgi:hypothetical protein
MLYDRSSRITMSRAPPAAAATVAFFRNGRANAATMRAMAASRNMSSAQLWIRRRRIDEYGIRRTNISEGNWTTFFRSR